MSVNLTWKWGQGRCIPSVRLLSHQMISFIHANYSEWKLIKRNYVSVNEDLGLCPSYNIIFTALPASHFYSPLNPLLWRGELQTSFIFKPSRWNLHLCISCKTGMGRAIKTSVRRTGETPVMMITQRRVFIKREHGIQARRVGTDSSLLQNLPSVPSLSSAVLMMCILLAWS